MYSIMYYIYHLIIIVDYVKELSEKHNLQLVLQNNNKKGYYISLTLNKYQRRTFKKSDLSTEFIYVRIFLYTYKQYKIGILMHILAG